MVSIQSISITLDYPRPSVLARSLVRARRAELWLRPIADRVLSSRAELRRRREEAQVEIRKTKREESIAKRRNFAGGDDSDSDADEQGDGIVSKPTNIPQRVL
jgi:hypothetical protein